MSDNGSHADLHAHDLRRHAETHFRVFDFFGARLDYSASRGEDEDRYEEIPHPFHGLDKSFAGIVDHAVGTVRQRFVTGDSMFQFRGGRLLASGFPGFPEPFARKLQSMAQIGKSGGYRVRNPRDVWLSRGSVSYWSCKGGRAGAARR